MALLYALDHIVTALLSPSGPSGGDVRADPGPRSVEQ
jgi:hypothetical protein